MPNLSRRLSILGALIVIALYSSGSIGADDIDTSWDCSTIEEIYDIAHEDFVDHYKKTKEQLSVSEVSKLVKKRNRQDRIDNDPRYSRINAAAYRQISSDCREVGVWTCLYEPDHYRPIRERFIKDRTLDVSGCYTI